MLIGGLYFVWLSTGGRLSELCSSMWPLNILMLCCLGASYVLLQPLLAAVK